MNKLISVSIVIVIALIIGNIIYNEFIRKETPKLIVEKCLTQNKIEIWITNGKCPIDGIFVATTTIRKVILPTKLIIK